MPSGTDRVVKCDFRDFGHIYCELVFLVVTQFSVGTPAADSSHADNGQTELKSLQDKYIMNVFYRMV